MEKLMRDIMSYIEGYADDLGVDILSERKEAMGDVILESLRTDPTVQEYISSFANEEVNGYAENLRTITVTIQVDEKHMRTEWDKELVNMDFIQMCKEELGWSLSKGMKLEDVKEVPAYPTSTNVLEQAMCTEIEHTALAMGVELSPRKLKELAQDFINDDIVWKTIDDTMVDLVQEGIDND